MEKLVDVDLERLYQQMSEDKELDKLLNTTQEEFEESTDPELKKYFYILNEVDITFDGITLLKLLKTVLTYIHGPKINVKFLENEEKKIIGFVAWTTSHFEYLKEVYEIKIFSFDKTKNIKENFTLVLDTLLNNGYNIYWSTNQENPVEEIYDRIDQEYQKSKKIENKIVKYSIVKE